MAIFMMLLAIAGIIVGVLTSSHSEPHSAVVDLGYARYQGRSLYNDVDEYLGMRFAKPPLDDLRFRAPEDPESSSDVQDASAVRFSLSNIVSFFTLTAAIFANLEIVSSNLCRAKTDH